MIDWNQPVEIKQTYQKKKYYESIGYQFTGVGEPLIITAKDLPKHSTVKINATCDLCGKQVKTIRSGYE